MRVARRASVSATDISVKQALASALLARKDRLTPPFGSDSKGASSMGIVVLSPLRVGGLAVARQTPAPLPTSATLGTTSALPVSECRLSSELTEMAEVGLIGPGPRRNPCSDAVWAGITKGKSVVLASGLAAASQVVA